MSAKPNRPNRVNVPAAGAGVDDPEAGAALIAPPSLKPPNGEAAAGCVVLAAAALSLAGSEAADVAGFGAPKLKPPVAAGAGAVVAGGVDVAGLPNEKPPAAAGAGAA